MNEEFLENPRTIERLQLADRYQHEIRQVNPGQTAFLVIDMQNQFAGLWSGETNQADLNHLRVLIDNARESGCLIVRTQHGHKNPDIDGGELHKWWGSSIIEGSTAHEFISGFEPGDDDIVIPKRRYNAFHETALSEKLAERHIKTIVIGGVMTNLCCETTARDAFCRDYSIIFLADGTATVTEAMQRGVLLNLGFGFACIMSCHQVNRWLSGTPS